MRTVKTAVSKPATESTGTEGIGFVVVFLSIIFAVMGLIAIYHG